MDKTQNLECDKIEKKNSNCAKTQELKLRHSCDSGHSSDSSDSSDFFCPYKCDKIKKKNTNLKKNSKTQIVTKLKNSICNKIQKYKLWKKTQKLKFWPNSKTQMVTKLRKNVTKLKNTSFGKTQKLKLWQKSAKSNCDKTQNLKLCW